MPPGRPDRALCFPCGSPFCPIDTEFCFDCKGAFRKLIFFLEIDIRIASDIKGQFVSAFVPAIDCSYTIQ
jgi:hypothetical protein